MSQQYYAIGLVHTSPDHVKSAFVPVEGEPINLGGHTIDAFFVADLAARNPQTIYRIYDATSGQCVGKGPTLPQAKQDALNRLGTVRQWKSIAISLAIYGKAPKGDGAHKVEE
jgi:hypothetical protein